jgi:excisionase family DNA binding protein
MITKANKADYQGASEYTGLAAITLRHLVSAGRIPYYKLGSRVFFDLDDLNTWIESKRIEPVC